MMPDSCEINGGRGCPIVVSHLWVEEQEVEFWDAHADSWLELLFWQIYIQTADMSVSCAKHSGVYLHQL